MHFSRSRVLAACVAVALALTWACGQKRPSGKPLRRTKQKVVIMGFDGMDPTLARKFMDEGKLPNLKRLADSGTFSKLETTQPSESPVAWQSFITGVNPGKHGIFDFLTRDFETYFPDPSMGVKVQPPKFLWGWLPTRLPKITSTRGGTAFWLTAGLDGVNSVVLTVPMTFPPQLSAHGETLSGLPLPDIRGTLGTFYYWATDLSPTEEGNVEFGGNLRRVSFENGVAHTLLKGPANPILKQEEAELNAARKTGDLTEKQQARLTALATGKDINVPIDVSWKPGTGQADIEVQGTKLTLKVGEWTPWVPLSFKINFLKSVHGMTQFYLLRANDELALYASPVNMDPRNPPTPISAPAGFSAELTEELGLYRTLGWAEATMPLQENRIDEAVFLSDCERAFADREKIILKNLERTDWDLFIAAIETTDRVSHMMWRLIDPKHPMYDAALAAKYGDSIEKIYERADGLVGRIQEKLPPGTTLIVMSDHGFHSFRRGVNLNTWLVQNGYMVFQGQEGQRKTLEDLFGRGKFWEGVDWSKTRAYAVGLGQIYFNLRGRESQGIVSSGAEYTALQEEIASKLVQLKDPDDDAQVMRAVYKRDDIYKGDFLTNAPDVQVGFNDGYRVGWQDTLGVIRRSVVENNNRKWSGDHCATATEISGGVIFTNRKLPEKPHITDLAPTVLKLLEVPIPADLDGKPLL
jgi:predicted AlkP superfamily phosphohydrolase/phosphomutase